MEYQLKELMCISAAREIKDGDIVFCGTGISMVAAMAAKKIHAPKSVIFFETGAVDTGLAELPMAVADPRVMYEAAVCTGLLDAFAFMQNPITGQHVIGILGAAQIDPYGNLNSTCIGDYFEPDIRFSGSGGACDVASFVPRSLIFMQQQRQKFVPKLDYRTSPGYLDGPDGRQRAGLAPGGPQAVITDMAIFRFDRQTGRIYLDGRYPGIEPEEVLENMGFAVETAQAGRVPPPSSEELRILRQECDPQGLIL